MESRRSERILNAQLKTAVKEMIIQDTFSDDSLRVIVREQCKDILLPEALQDDFILSGAINIMMTQN